MISKERLEELIEQEATIYDPDTMWKSIGEIKLNKKMKIKDGRLDGDLGDLGLKGAMCSCFVPLEDLVESKEEAEWIIEFSRIERTERLELPTWEEVQKCSLYTLYFNNQELYLYRVYFNRDAKTITIEEQNEGYLECFTEIEELQLTKENYLKACRKCKELFLGGSDGDIR